MDKMGRNVAMRQAQDFCRVCRSRTDFLFRGKVLNLDIMYSQCENCGYVQTEQPYWLHDAYNDVINRSDTGIMLRNIANRHIVLVNLLVLNILKRSVVDIAGGYGILVRLLRDVGVEALWCDSYCNNIMARSFEFDRSKTQEVELVTAFEAFEHFVDPMEKLEEMFEIAPNLLISTNLIADPAPPHESWWYYGRDHGQHVGFLRRRTLEYMAQKFGKHVTSNGVNYHLFSEKPINVRRWRCCMKLSALLYPIIQRSLKSKTWTDYLTITE